MMGDTIQQRRYHPGIAKYLCPLAKGEVGSDDQRGFFIKVADQVEQQGAA